MKFKYNIKNKKGSYVLEVSCANCKTPVFIYQKRGVGSVIRIHPDRIIESEVNFETLDSSLFCSKCKFQLLNKKVTPEKTFFRVIRAHINAKKLKSYRY